MNSCSQLKAIAKLYGFTNSWNTDTGVCFSYGDGPFPFWIVTDIVNESCISVYGRVRTYGLAGCRTDLHDWIGSLWSSCLRVLNVTSAWVVDEEGFVGPEEIYGRFLVLNQPTSGESRCEIDDEKMFLIFHGSAIAARMLSQIWCTSRISENDNFEYNQAALPQWLSALTYNEPSNKSTIYGIRSRSIAYHLDCSSHVSTTDLRGCPAWSSIWSGFFQAPLKGVCGETDAAHLLRSGNIRNILWKKTQRMLTKLTSKHFGDSPESVRFIPCESHLFAVTPSGICSKRVNSGRGPYAQQHDILRSQLAKNSSFLNEDIQFEWNDQIKPSRFEAFICELFARHQDTIRVKPIGHCNEPDGGRDLVVEVRRSFLQCSSILEEQKPNDIVQLIIQCKTSNRNIGKGAVSDIRDTVDHYNADGFLLVAVPGVTRHLFDYIEQIRRRKLFWIDSWTPTDIEAALRENPNVAQAFGDVVKVITPL